MKKFFGIYKGFELEKIALLAPSQEAAEDFCYRAACDDFCYSYDMEKFDEDEDEIEVDFYIEYSVEPFSYENEEHLEILELQEGEFWVV